MSVFDKNKNFELRMKADVRSIKMKVELGLFFFKKIEMKKEKSEINYLMENELQKWCDSKGYKFSIKEMELPDYVVGHSVYYLHSYRHYKILSFSK